MVTDASDHWVATTTLHQGPVWQARFGQHTPPHLIAAFTRALADPSPLLREGLPSSIPAYGTRLVTLTSREVPAVQVASALEDRVRALAARRAAPPTSPSPPRRPPSSPGRTR
ncbi:DUF317 domain-containing protein [Streptomyces tamarix]|uniref:DUF317 domain-containing protein n=1 Tax=Streptomyces tamarix TaxID=3078565 RepID=UPI0037041788